MTTRRQSRKIEELTPRTLSEEDSSGDETDPSVPPNSEEERQLLSAENDNEENKVVTTTIEDEGITTSDEVNNIAATAQAIANSIAGNGTADINHGLNTMRVSDAVARAISKASDSSSCSSTLTQDVEMLTSHLLKMMRPRMTMSPTTLKKEMKMIRIPPRLKMLKLLSRILQLHPDQKTQLLKSTTLT